MVQIKPMYSFEASTQVSMLTIGVNGPLDRTCYGVRPPRTYYKVVHSMPDTDTDFTFRSPIKISRGHRPLPHVSAYSRYQCSSQVGTFSRLRSFGDGWGARKSIGNHRKVEKQKVSGLHPCILRRCLPRSVHEAGRPYCCMIIQQRGKERFQKRTSDWSILSRMMM